MKTFVITKTACDMYTEVIGTSFPTLDRAKEYAIELAREVVDELMTETPDHTVVTDYTVSMDCSAPDAVSVDTIMHDHTLMYCAFNIKEVEVMLE